MDELSLEGFLGFSDEDLLANRGGLLSAAQRGRLRISGLWRLLVGPPLVVAGAVAALLLTLAPLSLAGLFLAGVGLYMTWRGFSYLTDGMEGAVAYVTAPIRTRLVRGRYGVTYWADVGPVSKSINQAAYASLPAGAAVHLYYSPGCRSLLSVEPATAGEPRPDHPFGPDSAHAWDRLRWSWVLFTIGALGVLIGAYQATTAHPVQSTAVRGTVTSFELHTGKSTSRYLHLDNGGSYFVYREDVYEPAVPPYGTLIGRPVTLYINQGGANGDVLAIDDGEQVHASDWYRHPEHQTVFMAVNAGMTAAGSALAFLAGLLVILVGRLRSQVAPVPAPMRYLPPSVQPVRSNSLSLVAAGGVMALTALGLALALGAGSRH